MKIIFLGTNGWYTTPTGNTPCILIDSKDQYVIFDAGNGIYKLDQYIKEDKPISLFISHFHIDHVSGFHNFSKFNFSQIINVYMAKGRRKDFDILVNPPFTSPQPPTQISIHELSEGKHLSHLGGVIQTTAQPHLRGELSNVPFPVEVIEQFHAYKDHGYRVTLEGKTIAYSGDCGISPSSLPLAKNADLLIHECSWKADHAPSNWGHVGPIEAAKLAKEAGVKKLILNHFDASLYTTIDHRKEAQKLAQAIFPNTIAATDNMIITL